LGLFIIIVKFIDDVEIVNWITRQCVGIHLLVMLWGSWNFCIYSQQWLVGDRCLWKNKGDGEKESMWLFSCYLIVLFSSFVFFFLIIRVLLHNSASCVVDKFDPRCRTNYWSWSCTAWNWINPILFSFLSVIDYDHTHVFAFCFVSFIMDEKQEFSFYSMIINILESILMLNQNQFYF
jgi:hypothetical protein